MSRVKIDLPGKVLAVIDIPVRISDINYGNHVGNDAVVSIIHEARVQWLRSLHLTELNIGGAGLIMSDLAVEFKAEVFYGDTLTVTIYTGSPSAVGFDLYYVLATANQIVAAKAKTGLVCFDYGKKKVTPLPETFKQILTG